MYRRLIPMAVGLGALLLSGTALAARTWPNSQQIGPITITPPSAADNNRLVVDVALHPINVNLYAGATRVAAKESITYPAGTYYSFKQAVDMPPLPGLPQ